MASAKTPRPLLPPVRSAKGTPPPAASPTAVGFSASQLVMARPAAGQVQPGRGRRAMALQPLTRGLPQLSSGRGRGGGSNSATGTSSLDRPVARRAGQGAVAGVQREVLDMSKLVGEVGFIAGRIAASARRCVVAPRVNGTGPSRFPRPVDVEDSLPEGSAPPELIRRFVRLTVLIGEVILVCPPPSPTQRSQPGFTLEAYRRNVQNWEAHSPLRVATDERGAVTISGTSPRFFPAEEAVALRFFVSDDDDASLPYSAAFACLPVLRELVGLSMHVGASVDSRMASAGVLTVSNSAEVYSGSSAPQADGSPADDDYLVGGQGVAQAITDVAVESIQDRDTAAAVAPIVIAQPDEAKAPHLLQFGSALDGRVVALRDQCLKRFALGMDTDPAILLGMGDSNHFANFSIESSFFSLTVAPILDDFAAAITVATGMPYAWDGTRVQKRVNSFVEVQAAYDRGEASGGALRRAAALSDKDAPIKGPKVDDPAVSLALRMADESPSLMQMPGLPDLVAQCRAVLYGEEYKPAPRPSQTTADPDKVNSSAGEQQHRDSPPPAEPSTAPGRSDGSLERGAEGERRSAPDS